MIFNILILAAIGGIAYFHYAQGFFSAFFSAVIAILAAVMAVSYHEPVVLNLLGGKMGDYANSMVLVCIFAGVYVLLRVLVDKTVPGNIRLPVIVDRIGGAAMGLIAGIFSGGILALAGAALPFGPDVYPRYALETREEITLPPTPGTSVQTTGDVKDQLTNDTFDPEAHKGLWIPADDIVLKIVQALSNGGSMAGNRTLKSVHPDYADELFAHRLGVQVGASHTALNLPGKNAQVSVPDPGIFRIDQDLNKAKLVVDAELPSLHQRAITSVTPVDPADKMQLAIRIRFTQGAADSDRFVRIAPASVRLCANERNYFPVGTWENGKLMANKADDFLIVSLQNQDRGADFVFLVTPDDVVEGNPKDKVQKVLDGVFVEVKRLARVDLSGRDVVGNPPPAAEDVKVERKVALGKSKAKGEGEDAAPAVAGPFNYVRLEVGKQLFSPINTGTPDKDVKNAQIQSGTLSMQSRQFTQLDINTTQTLALLSQGANVVSELFEPPGMKMVQVYGTPPAEAGDPWAWGTLKNYQLVDAAGKTYAPAGAWAKVKKDQADRMVAKFNAASAPGDVSGSGNDGRPTDVWIAFLVPSGTHLKEFKVNGKTAAQVDQAVP